MSLRDAFELEFSQSGSRDRSPGLGLDRRGFLKLFGGGLLVGFAGGLGWTQEAGRAFGSHEISQDIGAWLHIAADGRVKVFTGKAEIGQNIRTSLAQLVAEELRVPFASIEMVMGDTGLTPWDMGTFGSLSTPMMGPQLRTMAAAARQMLVEMAAKRWNADAASLTAADARVTDPGSSRSLSYGELTRGENLVKIVSGAERLTPGSAWKIAGTPVPKAEAREFVTGKHTYPSDVIRPGMLFGGVLRPDGFHATLESVDTSAAEKLPGVKVVRSGDFTGVVAPDAFTAQRALSAIRAKWNVPSQPSNRDLFTILKGGSGSGREAGGAVERAMAGADLKLEEQYTFEYIAHAPLEPRAAVAEWDGPNLTVWTGIQSPFSVRDALAQAFQNSSAQVRIIQPDMGGGFGGKHTAEAPLEAARLARAAGKPVKLVWTRREEFTWAYFRPAGLIEIRAGARRDGTLVAWEHHNYNSGGSAIETPYNVPNPLTQYHEADSPLRQGPYRSLAAAANHFARESHMDGVAHLAGMDPLEFRLKNLSDARLRAVFNAAAERFGWGRSKSTPARGFGIAGGAEKGGYVATCAEVEIDPASKKLRIRRVVQAWESGAIVNPDGLRNQNMGAIVQAIGGALFEQILFADGRILNPTLAEYRVPRFSDTPEVEIVLLDRKDLPSAGAGETCIVGLAPAVGNAIFAAAGVRLRNLPMAPRAAAPGEQESPFRS
jgi:isoquinoline 1-oxidoreductase